MRRNALSFLLVALTSGQAYAQSEPDAKPAPSKESKGAGKSSRLFLMPVADTVGAYQATLSYEGSLLKERGLLSSAGVFAVGIGDLAQIDYRHSSAIGVNGGSAPLPSVGVQLKLPVDTGELIPAIAVAYRLGLEHHENGAKEKATDVYGVAHLALPLHVDLHVGLRVTQASLSFGGQDIESTEWYPAMGLVRQVGSASAVLEVGRAPKFDLEEGKPVINSGLTGRLGLRWRVHPRFLLDASAGYLATGVSADPGDLLAWDIRLGGEVFVPWGTLACNSLSLFCN